MNRAARGILFYVVFVVYILYNFAWIAGLTFAWNKNDTYTEAWFIGLCFAGELLPLLIVPYRLRIGLLLTLPIIATSIIICTRLHMMSNYAAVLWFAPKALILALAIWMEKDQQEEYLA